MHQAATEAIDSLIRLATILRQVFKQGRDCAVGSVAKWLFIGQAMAPACFSIYGFLPGSRVFLFTVPAGAAAGAVIYERKRKRATAPSGTHQHNNS